MGLSGSNNFLRLPTKHAFIIEKKESRENLYVNVYVSIAKRYLSTEEYNYEICDSETSLILIKFVLVVLIFMSMKIYFIIK